VVPDDSRTGHAPPSTPPVFHAIGHAGPFEHCGLVGCYRKPPSRFSHDDPDDVHGEARRSDWDMLGTNFRSIECITRLGTTVPVVNWC
jgi:hypothetical protein